MKWRALGSLEVDTSERAAELETGSKIAAFADGRSIEYTASNASFSVAGSLIQKEDIAAQDSSGQVLWVSSEMRDWFYAWSAPAHGPAASKRKSEGAKRSSQRWTLGCLVLLPVALCALVPMWFGLKATVLPGKYEAASWRATSYVPDDAVDSGLEAAMDKNKTMRPADRSVFRITGLVLRDNRYIDRSAFYEYLEGLSFDYRRSAVPRGDSFIAAHNTSTRRVEYLTDVYEVTDQTRFHEAMHVIQASTRQSPTSGAPLWFTEGVADVLTQEYFDKRIDWPDGVYAQEVLVVRTLCELVGPEVVMRAYAEDSLDPIVAAVGEIGGDPTNAEAEFEGVLIRHEAPSGYRPPETLRAVFGKYFDAKFGEGYYENNTVITTYERLYAATVAASGDSERWPQTYYFNSTRKGTTSTLP